MVRALQADLDCNLPTEWFWENLLIIYFLFQINLFIDMYACPIGWLWKSEGKFRDSVHSPPWVKGTEPVIHVTDLRSHSQISS